MDKEKKTKKRIPCLTYSRVVGYLSPIHLWNDGKRQEWKDRRTYDVPSRERMGELS